MGSKGTGLKSGSLFQTNKIITMANGSQVILVNEEPLGPWQLIEIPVTANGVQKVPLPDVQQLRSTTGQTIIIKGMRLVTPKVLTNGMTVQGNNAPLAELQKISLVVFAEEWQKGQMMPILFLNNQADADATTATTIPYRNQVTKLDNWRNVDFPQSFLLFANGTVSANAPYVVMILVEYLKLNAKGEPIR